MSHPKCSTHPEVQATFRCDGCQMWLCQDCIEEGRHAITLDAIYN